jgi:hypothetical protein
MEGSRSFLKKRTKKLLNLGSVSNGKTAAKIIKSFLLLFFKKEVLPYLGGGNACACTAPVGAAANPCGASPGGAP